jgi:hypothetical protein
LKKTSTRYDLRNDTVSFLDVCAKNPRPITHQFCSLILRRLGSRVGLNSNQWPQKMKIISLIPLCIAAVVLSACNTSSLFQPASSSVPPTYPPPSSRGIRSRGDFDYAHLKTYLGTLKAGMTPEDAERQLKDWGCIPIGTLSSALSHRDSYFFLSDAFTVTLQYDEHYKLISWKDGI